MDTELELRFYRLYERLASLTQIVNQTPDIPQIESVLNEISVMFRLSKGVTHFYRSPSEEILGAGETMVSYDTGAACRPVHTVRFVTRLMSITTMTVFMADGVEPLTEDERCKVDLTMRTALAFISRNRLQRIAEELAFFDDNGFRNLRSFSNFLLWQGSLAGKCAILYNLRHFSLVNEEHGRAGGDTVLRSHYGHITEMIGSGGMTARVGEDTFVCLCDLKMMPALLEYLSEAEVPCDEAGGTTHISCYAGILPLPEGDSGYAAQSDLMSRLMHAMQIAQTGTQGNFVYYTDLLMSDKRRSRKIHKRFPEALKNGEFQVYYQPKVHALTGELCGAEALCRWFHKGERIDPADFIPVLEETSEICRLDYYVLDQVCGHIRKWLDAGRQPVRISVNLSRRHMMNPDAVSSIMAIIDGRGVPHEYIEIELTETTTDVEFRDLRRVVEGLQRQQICTSVDDFGMGYSSLNLIRAVPWNVLKVDRIFLPLDGEAPDSVRSVMFRHVIALSKELGLECIAEGVETPAQLALLRKTGCEMAQGFLFDKPLPLTEFEQRLEKGYYWYHTDDAGAGLRTGCPAGEA